MPADALESAVVLVVDDDDRVRRLLTLVLSEAGYVVLAVESAAAARALAEDADLTVDVLLTDAALPGSNGDELARHVSARHPGVAVLYMSGYDRDSLPFEARIPEEAFLAKPFTPEALVQRVEQVLAGRGPARRRS
jgi:two-component system, cell cycle sensor histidine kinase and response regulator CckA